MATNICLYYTETLSIDKEYARKTQFSHASQASVKLRAVARTLIEGVYYHALPTDFFQIDQFEFESKRNSWGGTRIYEYTHTPINVLATVLTELDCIIHACPITLSQTF